MKIAIQGEKGSFHHQAARQYFDQESFMIHSCRTFTAVFQAVDSGEVEFGLIACENSLYGSIHETYDQLIKYNFSVIGEVKLLISQQLIALPGVSLDEITEVLSHPAALDQCRDYLAKYLPNAQIIEAADTAGAVHKIASTQTNHQAAIGSREAAAIYDMEILRENIEDEQNNITRFLVLSKKSLNQPNADKASIILTTNHQPGALYQALKVFNDYDCNLTKLESRPIRGQAFRYQFIIDALTTQDKLVSIVHELQKLNCDVAVLGHYLSS